MNRKVVISAAAVALLGCAALLAQAQQGPVPLPTCESCGVSFFVADNPIGSGNLGGLAGGDQICQNAAEALGGRDAARTWRAYLSQEQRGAMPRINARDRIGNGPWYNAKHQLIASNVADLHGDQQRDRNNVRRETALDVRGEQIPGNRHDILTGSDPDGRAFTDGYDHTCNNWASEAMAYPQTNPNVPADRARAMIGHSDRSGQNTSWISSHLTQGCSKQALGGAGHLYCFAIN
jgi:hypothetical protein